MTPHKADGGSGDHKTDVVQGDDILSLSESILASTFTHVHIYYCATEPDNYLRAHLRKLGD